MSSTTCWTFPNSLAFPSIALLFLLPFLDSYRGPVASPLLICRSFWPLWSPYYYNDPILQLTLVVAIDWFDIVRCAVIVMVLVFYACVCMCHIPAVSA